MKKEELFLELIENLKEYNEHIPIIVEGKRDMYSLREMGIKGKIIVYNQGKNMSQFIDEISIYKEIIILIDWDERGTRLFENLYNNMISIGIKCNVEFRNNIIKMLGYMIKSVEELSSYYRRIEIDLLYKRPKKFTKKNIANR
ncbi:MAG: toprim domain-containing protein [Thermoplasmata archaeon]